MKYIAGWEERRGMGGGSSVPLPFPDAKAWLIRELERNLDRWTADRQWPPDEYVAALADLGEATGPFGRRLPGHVVSLEESR